MAYIEHLENVRKDITLSCIDRLQDEVDAHVNNLCKIFRDTYEAKSLEDKKEKTDEWLLQSQEIMLQISATKELIRILELRT